MWYLFGAVGLIAICGGTILVWNGLASKGWPSVKGVVLSADMEKHSTTGPGKASSWIPKIVYEYTVGEERFQGEKFSYKVIGGEAPRCRKIVAEYTAGDDATVYYNPTKPKQAVLVPGVSVLSYLPLVFGAFFTVLAILGILGALS